MKRIINTGVVFCMFWISFSAFAEEKDTCVKAEEIVRERLLFDIAGRRKRADLNEQIARQILEAVTMDRQMAGLKEKIFTAAPGEKEAIWAEYDAIGAVREKIMNVTVPDLKEKSSIVSRDKFIRLHDMKIEEVSQRYLCARNRALNEKLQKIAGKADPSVALLIKKRMELINEFTSYYAGLKRDVDTTQNEQKKLEYESDAMSKRSGEINDDANKKADELERLIDNFGDRLKVFDYELGKISEDLLHELGSKK